MTEKESEKTDDSLPTDLSAEALAKGEALAKAGRRTGEDRKRMKQTSTCPP